jgi:hypothetical protein
MIESTGIAMPRYKCHKEVAALKIKEVFGHGAKVPHPNGGEFERSGVWIVPEDSRYAPFDEEWSYSRHNPKPGGYYVVYADGYKSFSPGKAFEEGYTAIQS